jgi:serine/threonine protein kinase
MTIDASALQRRLADAFAGELEITGILGVGGFAAVFRAHDPILQRDVAIKVVDLFDAGNLANQEQFLGEARVVATVEHPHIVPLHSAEVRAGLLCLTMRLIPGRSLADRIAEEGPLAPADAARIAHEVAQALAAAHSHGVVHRDVKPENILMDASGHAIVTDFGISLVTGRASERTPGMVIGTPQYLSPEQALGEEVDGRADVYSLGVVLYEMLAGRLPFEARTTGGLLAKQIIEMPPPLASLRPDLPDKLVAATNRALAKSPNQRPAAEELAAELALARVPSALLSPQVVRSRKRWRRIRWTALGVVVLAAALGLAGWSIYTTYTTFSAGAVPSLSAMGPDNIPAGLVAAARADGSLRPGEIPQYAFVPSAGSWNDALLITDSSIVRRTAGVPRRYRAWFKGSNLQFLVFSSRTNRGLIVRGTGITGTDTMYTHLSGSEIGILLSAFLAIAPTHD